MFRDLMNFIIQILVKIKFPVIQRKILEDSKLKQPDWFYCQSGVVPFRRNKNGYEILLITSRKKKNWIVPKGIIEPGMTAGISATKEALEEAGVEGLLLPEPVGHIEKKKWGGTCRITIFLMEVKTVHEQWEEDDFRIRKWFPLHKAAKKVHDKKLGRLLEAFEDIREKIHRNK